MRQRRAIFARFKICRNWWSGYIQTGRKMSAFCCSVRGDINAFYELLRGMAYGQEVYLINIVILLEFHIFVGQQSREVRRCR